MYDFTKIPTDKLEAETKYTTTEIKHMSERLDQRREYLKEIEAEIAKRKALSPSPQK